MLPPMLKAALLLLLAAPALAQEADPRWRNDLLPRIGKAQVGGGFELPGYWVWDCSVLKGEDGLYHLFASRWPKRLPFHPGWMVASEVVHATAKTAEGPYNFRDVVLPARGAQYWDGRSTHNPKVVKVKDGYALFYMGSTHPFDDIADGKTLTLDSPYTTVGRSNKRVGLATAKSLNGPWTRREAPILDTKPATFYSFLTSNPAPLVKEDGSVLMLFKSRMYGDKFPYHSDMMIGVATAPRTEGPYTLAVNEPIFGVGRVGEVEDPFLWQDGTGYHVIAKDQRGTISGQKHAGILAHSRDGLRWVLDKTPLAYPRTITWSDGRTETMGQLERPFLLIQDGKPTHLFFSAMDGPGGFQNGTRTWDIVVRLDRK
jgi:hypothetical protein